MDAAESADERFRIFLSYAGNHSVDAEWLQFAYETLLEDTGVKVWTYERDQPKDEAAIAESLKTQVQASKAMVFLVTPSTLDKGAAQWMELAYADAFGVPTFVLLHHLSYKDLKMKEQGVPPLLLAKQCNPAEQWRVIAKDLRKCCSNDWRGSRI